MNKMTPQEKLKEIDDKLDEAHALVIFLNECRRDHINRYNLNKRKAMKDRIKFNDAMLAAVMDGRKTQARRPMKVQPILSGDWWEVYGAGWGKNSKSMPAVPGHSLANSCPYGKVGEIISVADKGGNIKGKIEITDVWLQQVQEISRQDAMREGAPPSHPSIDIVSHEYGFPDFSRSWFAQVWMDIYGEEGWDNNPWVWVIEFKKVE